MKLLLTGAATALLITAGISVAQGTFNDVTSTNQHYTAINYVQSEGIVSGYSDGTFRSDDPINRVELLKILMEAEHPQKVTCRRNYNYTDVDWSAWYGVYVQQASCLGIVEGYIDATFKPDNLVNAAEGLKLISEAFVLEAELYLDPWYKGYIEELVSKNAIPSDINNIGDSLTRGQMAEMIYRLKTNTTTLPTATYTSLTGEAPEVVNTIKIGTYCSDVGCNEVSITTDNQYRYITSNGLPNHEPGTFPNKGNPNAISEQNHSFKMLLNPKNTGTATAARIAGVALNGLLLEPGTAETYNGDKNWSIEAFDAEGVGGLGIDWSNAHVQPNGNYHYHGIPQGLLEVLTKDDTRDLVQLAWAADGFPMYYSQSNEYDSSWKVKSGTRPDGPGGLNDGTYSQDFEYVANSGDLDECNGTTINGSYAYIITNSFPYIQRCVFGTLDSTFQKAGRGPAGQTGNTAGSQPGAGGPPQAAVDACTGKPNNASCSFGPVNGGTCRNTPDGAFACVPS